MEWEEKPPWGKACHAFDGTVAVSLLQTLKPKTRCSIHFHRDRNNEFRVVYGSIDVVRYGHVGKAQTRAEEVGRIRLGPGMSHVVPSGVIHSFEVIEPGRVVEVYWADGGGPVRLDDIVRIEPGRKL